MRFYSSRRNEGTSRRSSDTSNPPSRVSRSPRGSHDRLARLPPAARPPGPEPGRDHRDADLVRDGVVDDRTEDHVRALVRRGRDHLSRLVHLEQPQLGRSGDVDEDAGRTLDRRLQQRRRHRDPGRLLGAVLALRDPDAHQRRTGVAHDRPHVGEVEVDEAGHGDQVGDALDALAEDVVGHAEGVDDRGLALDHLKQPVVLDHDQRVDLIAQGVDAALGLLAPPAALERERPRDDADGERVQAPRQLGDDGCRAGARAAPLAGGDEDHVRALQCLLELVPALLRGGATNVRVGPGAEAVRPLRTDLELDVAVAHQQRLRVGVHRDELDAPEARVDHSVDGVRAAAAHADDLDHCEVVTAWLVARSQVASTSSCSKA